MSLFGAKKQEPLKDILKRAKENFEEKMSTISAASATSSSHIGDLIKDREGPLPTDPDGTATTSEIAREELGDYLGESQLEPVTVSRELFNQGVQVHNAEMRARGHPSQMLKPVLPVNADEDGNRLGEVDIHTISSDDSSLSPPPTTVYGGSSIQFPSQTP